MRALVIGDPASGPLQLDAAREEAVAVAELLGKRGVQCTLLVGAPEPGTGAGPLNGVPAADYFEVVDLLLADLDRRLAEQDITLELTPAAKALIVREGTDPAFGARPLKRTIQRLVENQLARALVSGEFRPGDRVTADADLVPGTLVFSTEDATVVSDGGRRDARTSDQDPVGAAVGDRPGSPLDLPPTRKKRDDGELVN